MPVRASVARCSSMAPIWSRMRELEPMVRSWHTLPTRVLYSLDQLKRRIIALQEGIEKGELQ